jgi:hypothetical protein
MLDIIAYSCSKCKGNKFFIGEGKDSAIAKCVECGTHAIPDVRLNKVKDIKLDAKNPLDNDWKIYLDGVWSSEKVDSNGNNGIYHVESVTDEDDVEKNILDYDLKLVKVLSYIIDGKPIPHKVPFATRWMFVKSIDYAKKELYLSFRVN